MGSLSRVLPEMKAYEGSDVAPRLEITVSSAQRISDDDVGGLIFLDSQSTEQLTPQSMMIIL